MLIKCDNKIDGGENLKRDSQKIIEDRIEQFALRKIFQLLECISIIITRSTFPNGITKLIRIEE